MTHISEIPVGTLVKQAHAGVKLIADQYPEVAAILREAITRFDVLKQSLMMLFVFLVSATGCDTSTITGTIQYCAFSQLESRYLHIQKMM